MAKKVIRWGDVLDQNRWDVTHADVVDQEIVIHSVFDLVVSDKPAMLCEISRINPETGEEVTQNMLLGSQVAQDNMRLYLDTVGGPDKGFPVLLCVRKIEKAGKNEYYILTDPSWEMEK